MSSSHTSAKVGEARISEGTESLGRACMTSEVEHLSGRASFSEWPVALTPLLAIKSCINFSTLAMRSTRYRLPFLAGDKTSGKSWLTHGARRRWQPMQVTSSVEANVHLIFRRLHSQQDRVPLRIFRRLRDLSWSAIAVPVSSSRGFIMAGCGQQTSVSAAA